MQVKHHYLALDGLRGVAALAVMVMHRGRWFYVPGGFIGHAWLAVDFFFLLSGFVIAAAYETRLQNTLTIPGFLRLRLIRLYPLILLGMVLGLGWPLARMILGDPGAPAPLDLASTFLRGLFLIPAVVPDPTGWGLFPLNGPAWSLFFEIIVNLAYVLVARRLTTPILVAIIAVAGCLVATLPFVSHLDAGASGGSVLGGFARTAFGFFAGVLIWRLKDRWPVMKLGAPVWVLALALVAVFIVPQGHVWTPAFELACVFLVFPAILVLGANAPPTPKLDALSRLSGGLSYPLYALHYPLLVLVGGLGAAFGWLRAAPPPLFGMIAYPLVLALCWLAWKAYDEPLRAWLSRRVARAEPAVKAAPV